MMKFALERIRCLLILAYDWIRWNTEEWACREVVKYILNNVLNWLEDEISSKMTIVSSVVLLGGGTSSQLSYV